MDMDIRHNSTSNIRLKHNKLHIVIKEKRTN
jgi:hypothetical protein